MMIDESFIVSPNTLDENNPLECRLVYNKEEDWEDLDVSIGNRWGETYTIMFTSKEEFKDYVARLVAFRDQVCSYDA